MYLLFCLLGGGWGGVGGGALIESIRSIIRLLTNLLHRFKIGTSSETEVQDEG